MGERTRRVRTALAGLAVAVVVLGGCDWAQLGFGPEATNFDPYEPALTPATAGHLTERWSAACVCVRNRPLVVGDSVYAMDTASASGSTPFTLTLRAFAVADGRPRWSTPLGQAESEATLAAVGNGLVYVVVRPVAASDQLVAIDTTSGTVRWRRTPPTPGSGRVRIDPPVLDGALVLVTATASDASTLSAYDPTGRRVWTVVPGGQVFPGANPAVVPGETVYVSSSIPIPTGGLVLLRGYAVADGTVRSTATISNALPVQSLAVANGLVYGTFFTSFGRLGGPGTFAVHPDTGAIAWTGELFTLAVTPGVVLSNNPRTGDLVAHQPVTGAPLWTTTQTDFRAAATDRLVFFSEGDVRRLATGLLVGKVRTAGGVGLRLPTPSGGRVFAFSPDRLYALAP
jgi:outer membrane protein assembly factor BamB